jgi:hypothetical protein
MKRKLKMSRRKMISITVLLNLFLHLSISLIAQEKQKTSDWDHWKFLLGEWVGEGGGNVAGQGTGESKFFLDLDDNVLVRESYADFPASKDRPAYTHRDKMIIYQQASSTRAIYFDNEGHVINYDIKFSDDFNTITFLSELMPEAPRFRLTYTKQNYDRIKLDFEIAPPNKPDSFSPYLTAISKHK